MIGLSFLVNYKDLLVGLDQTTLKKLADSFSLEEYESAKWIVNELVAAKIKVRNVAILGSSFSTYLVPMLCTRIKLSNIVLYDLDKSKMTAADILHRNIKEGVRVSTCVGNLEEINVQIEQSEYDLVIVPYGDKVPALANCRVKSNKTHYIIQATIGEDVKEVNDLIVLSGCIQQGFRGIERMGKANKVMIFGTKRIR